MKIIKGRFGRWIEKIAGGFANGVLFSGGSDTAAANIGWIALTILMIAASIAICYFFKVGIGLESILALAWGSFVGFSLLIHLPSKLLMTFVGGTVSVAGTGLAGLGDTVEKLTQGVNKISSSINSSLNGTYSIHPSSVILFLIFVTFFMLPAYKYSDNS